MKPPAGGGVLLLVRKTLVSLGLVGALGVLAVRLWPSAEAPRAPAPVIEAAPPTRVIALAGDIRDEDACAAPAIQAIQRHPNWELVIAEREWDDVVDDNPDETYAVVRITADHAVWTAGSLPQTIELVPGERTELLAAVQRSCVKFERDLDLDGYSGHYITLSYGASKEEALRIPGRSPAVEATRAVLDKIRARYVQSRLPTARVMTVTFAGRRNLGEGWRPYFVTLHADGLITTTEGDASTPLAASDLVDVLDWALKLPAQVPLSRALAGTIEIAGSKKPIAIDPLTIHTQQWGWRNPYLDALAMWGMFNERHGNKSRRGGDVE